MPGPLPGMDPYLENPSLWPDAHQSLITYMRDSLQPRIRPHYQARIGERVYILDPPYVSRFYPDVMLIQRPGSVRGEAGGSATAVVEAEPLVADEPHILMWPPGEYREPYLEIFHASGGAVVTAIEVLSPANKTPGTGYTRYRDKQKEVLESRAHLIEIDLLSQGRPTIEISPEDRQSMPHWRYLVGVHRFPFRQHIEVYMVALSRPLPLIRIPLKAPDPDVPLDLQAVLNRCYDNGGYTDFLDYRRPPPVPLSPEEQFWMEAVLREKGVLPSAEER